ncbi:MAG: MarR family winged helix-turn-helix transcriptional regulator [Acidimicrobiales bacterium]
MSTESQPDPGTHEGSTALRTLAVAVEGVDETWEVDDRLAALWRAARLGPTVERLRRHVLQAGAESIEPGQFRALDAVAGNGPCAIRELAVVMGLEPSSVTRAVNRLEASGLVRKRRAQHDHREVLVELTEEGLRRHQFFVDRAFGIYYDIFAVFSHDERIVLADLLERMLKSTDLTLAAGVGTTAPPGVEPSVSDS